MPRSVAVPGHPVSSLLIDGNNVPLSKIMIRESVETPIQNAPRLLFPSVIPFGMLQDIKGHGVGVDFRVGVLGGIYVLKKGPPSIGLKWKRLYPIDSDFHCLHVVAYLPLVQVD